MIANFVANTNLHFTRNFILVRDNSPAKAILRQDLEHLQPLKKNSMRQILDKKTWKELREKLKDSYTLDDNWEKAIKLFEERIEDFYLKPIHQILKLNKNGEGFSILTLQCALIEMFAAFRKGKIHNHYKPENGFKYEYKDSNNCFVDFLHEEAVFENNFFIKDKNGIIQKNQPFSAKKFYTNVRCGLMHEARTKKDWLITANSENYNNGKFIFQNPDGAKSINRTILQEKLESYFNEIYLSELKSKDLKGEKLRRLFARKLDHLHDINRNINYDWWKDK